MTTWSIVVVTAAMLASAVIVLRVPRLAVAHEAGDDLLVIIPARNEAAVIGSLLDDLAQQTAQPAQVVVVDDQSTDSTREVVSAIARARPDLRVDLRTAPPRPPGWNPKSWAMHHGVAGNEPWLLFLDADVRLAPDALGAISALRASVTSADSPGPTDAATGVVSVAPRHDTGSLIEGLSLPFNLIAIMGATRCSRTRGDANAAFGPCLLVSREAYDAVGGHAAVHADLLDDVALAQRMRSHGRDVRVCVGSNLVQYRMYPHGLRALVDGWSKNIASGATRVSPVVGLATGLWVSASLLPLWLLVVAHEPSQRAWALGLWLVVAVHTAVLARRVGRFGWLPVLLAPLGAMFFVLVTVRSAFLLVARRPVPWKGRLLGGERGIVDG